MFLSCLFNPHHDSRHPLLICYFWFVFRKYLCRTSEPGSEVRSCERRIYAICHLLIRKLVSRMCQTSSNETEKPKTKEQSFYSSMLTRAISRKSGGAPVGCAVKSGDGWSPTALINKRRRHEDAHKRTADSASGCLSGQQEEESSRLSRVMTNHRGAAIQSGPTRIIRG